MISTVSKKQNRSRTIRVLSRNELGMRVRITVLTPGRADVKEYDVDFMPTSDGEGFYWTQKDAETGADKIYCTVITNNQDHYCDCPGHTHRGHCRHVEAVQALRRANVI